MTGGDRGTVGQGIYGRMEGAVTSRRMESLTSKSPTGLRNDGCHKNLGDSRPKTENTYAFLSGGGGRGMGAPDDALAVPRTHSTTLTSVVSSVHPQNHKHSI